LITRPPITVTTSIVELKLLAPSVAVTDALMTVIAST
jgi:hypothetical protein